MCVKLPRWFSPHKLLTGPCLRSGTPMNVLALIDKLDELVRHAKHVPLSSEMRVDKEKLNGLLWLDARDDSRGDHGGALDRQGAR